ncbi:MAG: DUF192 domain-containing protein [Dehalococcoidia bacterium]
MTHRLYLALTASVLLLTTACSGDKYEARAPASTPAAAAGCTATPAPAAAVVTSVARPPATPEPTASTGATTRAQLPLVEFVRGDGSAVCLPTEVLPRAEFTTGLSGRYFLDERGMLFYFANSQRGSFWMKNTHVDLSIAFVGADSRIVEVREMKAESLDYITPAADYLYAIEAQPGWYARNGIAAGNEVRFDAGVTAQLPQPE